MIYRNLILSALVLVSSSLSAESVDGRWKAVLEAQGNERDYFVELSAKNGNVRGSFISPRSGKYPIEKGSFDGKTLKFSVEREYNGSPVLVDIEANLQGDGKLAGDVGAQGNDFATIVLTRMPSPVGSWAVKSESPDGSREYESSLVVSMKDGAYAARVSGQLGELKVDSLKWKGEAIVLAFTLPTDERDVPIAVEAKFKDADALVGEWSAEGNDQTYTGSWKATRVRNLAGSWEVEASTDDGESDTSQLVFSNTDDGFKGKYSGRVGDNIDLSAVRLEGSKVHVELKVELEGNEVTFIVDAKFDSADSLVGKWRVKDNDEFSGPWKARRKPAKEAAPKDAEKETATGTRRL